jgi:hypothetical protein
MESYRITSFPGTVGVGTPESGLFGGSGFDITFARSLLARFRIQKISCIIACCIMARIGQGNAHLSSALPLTTFAGFVVAIFSLRDNANESGKKCNTNRGDKKARNVTSYEIQSIELWSSIIQAPDG